MRYYKITFSNPNGGFPSGIPNEYTSHPNGIYNPGCPEIQFDIPNVFADATIPDTHLRIHNVPVSLIENARQYNGMRVVIEGGFKQAIPNYPSQLPLENPLQAGILGQGTVQTCYGNWLGTDLVLDFLIWPNPNLGSSNTIRSLNTGAASPYPFAFSWKSGSISDAILTTLKVLGVTKIQGNISDKLQSLPANTEYQWYATTFSEFANYILNLSVLIVKPPAHNKDGAGVYGEYTGLHISINGDSVILFDGTKSDNTNFVQLKLQEFIGQPTWVSADGKLQSVHPMRNDIVVGGEVRYPAGIPSIIAPQNSPTLRQYNINESAAPLKVFTVRHLGQYRGTSATSWCTYVTAGSAIRINPTNQQAGVPQGQVNTTSNKYTPVQR